MAVPVALLLLAIGAAIGWFSSPPAPLSGKAFVVDGDTLRIGGARVRLNGIDAPELDQTCTDANNGAWRCGDEARNFLAGLAAGRDASCIRTGRDRYHRWLATCSVGGADLGGAIVAAGWAVADLGYAAEESEAEKQRRGIWSGTFMAPSEWRRTHGDEPGIWDWIRSWFQ
jgi:endonuclease YncB( thermonuclease family)